jgi:predicted O-linked N-acetylglucosamine transferase (SPINDLY family)
LQTNPQNLMAHDSLLFALHCHPDSDAASLFAESRNWSRQHAEPLQRLISKYENDRTADRPLRLGYVSPDLRNHPVGQFVLPLLDCHDRNAFQVICYAEVPAPDEMTAKLQTHVDTWRSIVGLSDEQTAEMIRQDRIDILVDLAMHTANNRLLVFARKPAPVQVTYLAYPGGTGLETIDYRLTDRYLDPDEADDRYYVERSIRLSGSYWCYQPSDAAPAVNELPALSAGRITLGCLNNYCKVTRPALETWARLLNRLGDARLLLHSPPGNHRESLMRYLTDRGITPDRVELVGRVSPEDYFQTYCRMDVALDPFPYCGGTTTCDALWMGVPVVTLSGRTAVGRSGVSILSNAGLPELIARTPEEYERIVAELAGDLPRLRELRSTLRQWMQQSPLMDAAGFARGVETAYRDMWRQWCQVQTS